MDHLADNKTSTRELASGDPAARLASLSRQQLTQCLNSCFEANNGEPGAKINRSELSLGNMETSNPEQHSTAQSQHEVPIDAGFDSPAIPAVKPVRPRGYKHGKKGIPKSQLVCKVDGCRTPLSSGKAYYQRHRVCAAHLAAMVATVDGVDSRFCQQCGKFQPIEEFDTDKRSCRTRLKRHNNRRREQRHGRNIEMRNIPSEPSASHHRQEPADAVVQEPCDTEPQEVPDLQGVSGYGKTPAASNPEMTCSNPSSAAKHVTSPNGSTGTHDGSNNTPAHVCREVVRRTSATKALEAMKTMNASCSSTASEFEDSGAEESHQQSPMAAAVAAPSCRPRRRLDMSAVVASSSRFPGDQVGSSDKESSQLQGILHQQEAGVWHDVGSSQLASIMQAASVAQVYNKCGASLTSPAVPSNIMLGRRSSPGSSRFATMQQSQVLAGQPDAYFCQQQQLLAWQLDETLMQQHSRGFRADGVSCRQIQISPYFLQHTQVPVVPGVTVRQTSCEQYGSLAQHHSAPPLLHTTSNASDHDEVISSSRNGPTAAAIAASVVAGRSSDGGCLTATAAEFGLAPPHLQQQLDLPVYQQPPSIRTALIGGYNDTSAGTFLEQQLHFSNNRTSCAGDAGSMHSQQQDWSSQAFVPAEGCRTLPSSIQVLDRLRRQGVFSPPNPSPLAGNPLQQRQCLDVIPPGQQLSLDGPISHPIAAMSAAPHTVHEPPARMSDGGLPRRILSPFQIAIGQQPRGMLLRNCVSYSGGVGSGMLGSPCISLTAPLQHQNLAGISLHASIEQPGRQRAVQQYHSSMAWSQLQQSQGYQHSTKPGDQQELPSITQLPQQQLSDSALLGEAAAAVAGDDWTISDIPKPAAERQRQLLDCGSAHWPAVSTAAVASWQQYQQVQGPKLPPTISRHATCDNQRYPCTQDVSAGQHQHMLQESTSEQNPANVDLPLQDGCSTQHHWQSQERRMQETAASLMDHCGFEGVMCEPRLEAAYANMIPGDIHSQGQYAAESQQLRCMRSSIDNMPEDAAGQITATPQQQPVTQAPVQTPAYGADKGCQHGSWTPVSTADQQPYPLMSLAGGQQYHSHELAGQQGPGASEPAAAQQYTCATDGIDSQQHTAFQDPTSDQQHLSVQDTAVGQQYANMQDAADQLYPCAPGSDLQEHNQAANNTQATGSQGDPFLQCMSTDEDFGDLLELLLEGEEVQQ